MMFHLVGFSGNMMGIFSGKIMFFFFLNKGSPVVSMVDSIPSHGHDLDDLGVPPMRNLEHLHMGFRS